MFMLNKRFLAICSMAAVLGGSLGLAHAETDFDLGRAATPAELHAWDIDVRPDFKGLPPGSGTVEQGSEIWDASCASCHGSFAESNEVFAAIIGGTTTEDIKNGHVASLTSNTQPVRTTFMKVDTISTLWDYIHRAMPWNDPKSLAPDDVYAVLAYLLNLAEVVPEDFTLSDENIDQVQAKMPNRDGMVFWKGMWTADGKPDTHNTACMADCVPEPKVSSKLPDYARDLNGNLAAQMRIVGPVRGVDTLKPALTGKVGENISVVKMNARSTLEAPAKTAASSANAGAGEQGGGDTDAYASAAKLTADYACMACHAVDKKLLGPSFQAIAGKYKGDKDALTKLVKKVRDGGSGVWGNIPMPPHPNLDDADSTVMLEWILAGAPAAK